MAPSKRLATELRPVRQFSVAALATLLVVTVGAVVASRQAGEREAISDVRKVASVLAETVVQPNIAPELLLGDAAAIARFDQIISERVRDDSVFRINLWTPDGLIVYSDEPRLIGNTFELDAEKLASLEQRQVVAEVSDLGGPENVYDQSAVRLLEVYVPIWGPDSTMLLYEAYFSYDVVDEASSRIWGSFAPILIGSLVILAAAHFILGWLTTRRLRKEQSVREELLKRAIDASEVERRRIAADLHDGVVQDLVSVSFGLSAAAQADRDQSDLRRLLSEAAAGVRRSIRALRSLMVDIYPPNLHRQGLEAALIDLLEPLEGKGITTTLHVPPGLRLDREQEALVFRLVQEAVRNSAKHANATELQVVITNSDGIRVEITDNGVGFDVDEAKRDRLGLQLMRDLASDSGAELVIDSAPGEGATVVIKVPA